MKLMSLHRAWTIWTIALLAIWTLSGCGGNVSIPDTPDAAITEAQKKVKVAADASHLFVTLEEFVDAQQRARGSRLIGMTQAVDSFGDAVEM